MDLRQLEIFVTAYEKGSLSRAAECLNTSQPNVSKNIRALEEELGRPATLVVTGGLAKYVTPLCRHPLTYDPELLLEGLALLYQLNAPQQHHHPAGGRKPHGQNFRRHRPFRRERHETEAKAG